MQKEHTISGVVGDAKDRPSRDTDRVGRRQPTTSKGAWVELHPQRQFHVVDGKRRAQGIREVACGEVLLGRGGREQPTGISSPTQQTLKEQTQRVCRTIKLHAQIHAWYHASYLSAHATGATDLKLADLHLKLRIREPDVLFAQCQQDLGTSSNNEKTATAAHRIASSSSRDWIER